MDRFKALPEAEREAFRASLAGFKSLYGFLAQTVPFADAELEKLYAFGRMLLRKLPRTDTGPLDLGDEVALKTLLLKKQGEGDLGLEPGKGDPLTGPTAVGTGAKKGPKVKLSTIIEVLNERFGTDFDAQDLVDGVSEQLAADEEVQQAAKANDKTNFGFVLDPKLTTALLDRHAKHGEFIDKVFADETIGKLFRDLMLDAIYKRLSRAGEAAP